MLDWYRYEETHVNFVNCLIWDILGYGKYWENKKKGIIFMKVLNYIPKLRGFVILWKKLSVVLTYLHTQTVTKRQERKNYSPNIF